jgi:NAD(P)-dependent dehydrogenase (short-subunit alcohol dehydrogenase family)
MKKVVLVTGASTGLGLSVCVAAARAGHTVFATMRDLARRGALDDAARAAGVELQVLALDVQDETSVRRAVAQALERAGHIDVLVNNAGVGFARATDQTTLEEIERVMDINFMGAVRTTQAVLPHLRARRAGHIVNITSVGGLVGQPFNEVYCASKFALEGYTESLAAYVTPHFNVRFTAVEPGGIRSEFAASAMKQIQASGGLLQDEYLPLLQRYIGGATARGTSAYQDADEVAAVVLRCIDADDPPVRVRTSAWAEALCELKTRADPDGKKLQRHVIDTFLGA